MHTDVEIIFLLKIELKTHGATSHGKASFLAPIKASARYSIADSLSVTAKWQRRRKADKKKKKILSTASTAHTFDSATGTSEIFCRSSYPFWAVYQTSPQRYSCTPHFNIMICTPAFFHNCCHGYCLGFPMLMTFEVLVYARYPRTYMSQLEQTPQMRCLKYETLRPSFS
jgi:hypothetical protein